MRSYGKEVGSERMSRREREKRWIGQTRTRDNRIAGQQAVATRESCADDPLSFLLCSRDRHTGGKLQSLQYFSYKQRFLCLPTDLQAAI
jgi:hypothetical protein